MPKIDGWSLWILTLLILFSPSDISILLGLDNVAIRVGKVCAHPYVNKLTDGKGILRVSTGVYNTEEDCEKLVKSLCKAMKKIKG